MYRFAKMLFLFALVIIPNWLPAEDACLNSKQVIGSNLMLVGGPGLQHLPFIAYSPRKNNYLLLWAVLSEEEQTVWGQFFDQTAKQTSAPMNFFTGPGFRGSFAERADAAYNSMHDEFLVTWSVYDRSGGCERAVREGRLLSSTGEWKSDTFTIARQDCSDGAHSFYEEHQLIYNPVQDEYVSVFSNLPGNRILVQRIRNNGMPISAPVGINNPESGSVVNAHLRHDPKTNRYLVTWDLKGVPPQPKRAVMSQFLTPELRRIGKSIMIAEQNGAPNSKLVYMERDHSFMVFWQSCNKQCFKSRKVQSNGVMNWESTIPLSGYLDDIKPNPDSKGFTLIYRAPAGPVKLARLRQDMSLAAPQTMLTCEETTYPGFLIFNPKLHEYLAVWSYYENDVDQKDIFAQRVRATPMHE